MYLFLRSLPPLRSFGADKRAVTAIEYVLIASIIALAVIVGVKAIGLNLNSVFSSVAGQL